MSNAGQKQEQLEAAEQAFAELLYECGVEPPEVAERMARRLFNFLRQPEFGGED